MEMKEEGERFRPAAERISSSKSRVISKKCHVYADVIELLLVIIKRTSGIISNFHSKESLTHHGRNINQQVCLTYMSAKHRSKFHVD